MAVTQADIAKLCGLSNAAVSHVLGNPSHPEYPEITRAKVLEAAEKLNYIPNKMAAGFRRGKTQLLSLVMPWNNPELMDEAEEVAADLGYEMMVQFTTRPDPKMQSRAVRNAIARRVDGIIWLPGGTAEDCAKIIAPAKVAGTPMVVLEVSVEGLPDYSFVRPEGSASTQVMSHLRDQGYKQLVLVTFGLSDIGRNRRVEELISQAAGYDMSTQVIAPESYEGIKAGLAEHMSTFSSDKPVAFFCDNDWIGVNTIHALKARGISVPEEAGVITLGDSVVGGEFRIGELVSPQMTTVRWPFREMAKSAVLRLKELIENSDKSSLNTQTLTFPEKLIVRESTNRKVSIE